MSFVPAPQKATSAGAANATNQINGTTIAVNNVTPAAAEAVEAGGGEDAFITSRTFDLYWVDKTALMYKDGYVKVRLFYGVLLRGWGGGGGGGVEGDGKNKSSYFSVNHIHIMISLSISAVRIVILTVALARLI